MLLVILLSCACVLFGCAGTYYYRKYNNLRSKNDDSTIRLSKLGKNKRKNENAMAINRNTWNMTSIELSARKNPKKIGKGRKGKKSKKKTENGGFQLNPVRTSAIGFAVEEKLPPNCK